LATGQRMTCEAETRTRHGRPWHSLYASGLDVDLREEGPVDRAFL
jgi:hypothetical protein